MGLFKALFGNGEWAKAGIETDIEISLRREGIYCARHFKHPAVQAALRAAADKFWSENEDICRRRKEDGAAVLYDFKIGGATLPVREVLHKLIFGTDL